MSATLMQEPEQNDNDADATTPDNGDSVFDNDADTDSGDSTPDDADAVSEQTDDDADTSDTSAPDNDTDTDSGDSAPDNDNDIDTTPANPCNPNPCTSIADSTKECSVFGGTTYKCECNSGYYWDGSVCGTAQTQTATCTGLTLNAEWNTVSEIIQTWDENYGQWVPSNEGSYNETASTNRCRYKCKENYFWNDLGCVTPCNSDSCSSDPNFMCVATNVTDYTCLCKTGSTWNESESMCTVDPANLPECSPTSATPCYDSTSHLTWSKKSVDNMTYDVAMTYCSGSEMQGYGGFSDWRLPNIDELKTLLVWNMADSCKVSEKNDCLSDNGCWTCNTCSSCGNCINPLSCQYYNDGRFSKLGDSANWGTWGRFWSSSLTTTPDFAWYVDFGVGSVLYNQIDNKFYVRCVRNADQRTISQNKDLIFQEIFNQRLVNFIVRSSCD